jgi:hypothetical protein
MLKKQTRFSFSCLFFCFLFFVWDVRNVTVMTYVFANTTSLNQSLEKWDVHSATNMSGMFCVFSTAQNEFVFSFATATDFKITK